jgi:hypothetical protein
MKKNHVTKQLANETVHCYDHSGDSFIIYFSHIFPRQKITTISGKASKQFSRLAALFPSKDI